MKIQELLEDVSGQAAASAFGDISSALRKSSADPVRPILDKWDDTWNSTVKSDPSAKQRYGLELQKFVAFYFDEPTARKLNVKRTVNNGKPDAEYIRSFFASNIKNLNTKSGPSDLTAKPRIRFNPKKPTQLKI